MLSHRRGGGRVASASSQANLNALTLARDWSTVDVVLAVAGRARIEGRRSTVGEGSVASDGEVSCWGGSSVTLELSGWRGENASTALGIGDLPVVDGISALRGITANMVLSITELSESSGLAP